MSVNRQRCRNASAGMRPLKGFASMAYVITEPCIGEKDASCVEVCPVDCIHAREEDEQYYIDPHACIDCGACLPVCPVKAIFPLANVPERWRMYIKRNADYFGSPSR
jgi:ferredoxin